MSFPEGGKNLQYKNSRSCKEYKWLVWCSLRLAHALPQTGGAPGPGLVAEQELGGLKGFSPSTRCSPCTPLATLRKACSPRSHYLLHPREKYHQSDALGAQKTWYTEDVEGQRTWATEDLRTQKTHQKSPDSGALVSPDEDTIKKQR